MLAPQRKPVVLDAAAAHLGREGASWWDSTKGSSCLFPNQCQGVGPLGQLAPKGRAVMKQP